MSNLRKYGKMPFNIAVIHGGPGAAGEMASVALALSSYFGILEPLQTKASLKGQIQELKAILEKNAKLPVILIGFSWGAWLSFILAGKYPGLVKKLILIGSGGYEGKYGKITQSSRLKRLAKKDKLKAAALIKFLENAPNGYIGKEFGLLGEIFSKADTFDPINNTAKEFKQIDARFDIFRAVWKEAEKLRETGRLLKLGRRIQCPVIAIHGDYDPHPAEGVQGPLSRVLKNFRFVLLKNCGHKPWIERKARDKFFKIIIRQLR